MPGMWGCGNSGISGDVSGAAGGHKKHQQAVQCLVAAIMVGGLQADKDPRARGWPTRAGTNVACHASSEHTKARKKRSQQGGAASSVQRPEGRAVLLLLERHAACGIIPTGHSVLAVAAHYGASLR